MNSTEGRAWYVTLDISLSRYLRATQIHLRDWRDITGLLPSPSIFCIGWMKPVLDSYPVSRSCMKRPRQCMVHCFRYLFALAQTLRIFGARRFRLCYVFCLSYYMQFVCFYSLECSSFSPSHRPQVSTPFNFMAVKRLLLQIRQRFLQRILVPEYTS